MDVLTERGKECGIGNGLDRGHVDVVVDDIRTPNTSKDNKSTKSNYK